MSLTILHVEDHKVVADAVRETLEGHGWKVVTCIDGAVALTKLASTASYDLLITDNHLPNVNGIEIVCYARRLAHRKHLPIVMLSATECHKAAIRAGANVYLSKPEGVNVLVETIAGIFNGTHS